MGTSSQLRVGFAKAPGVRTQVDAYARRRVNCPHVIPNAPQRRKHAGWRMAHEESGLPSAGVLDVAGASQRITRKRIVTSLAERTLRVAQTAGK